MHARRRAGPARSALIVTTLFAWACAEQTTAPQTVPLEGQSSPSLFESAPASTASSVHVLERTEPLAEEERVSRTIGPLGGVIVLPRAGLTVVVPPGALPARTDITVVAPAGRLVGYHFLPEGHAFEAPLVLQQFLMGTEASSDLSSAPGRNLVAAYFQGELTSVVDALELLSLDVLGTVAVFRVEHFSGYVVGTN